jgi:hypothetical protein
MPDVKHIEELISKHERLMNECRTKAFQARSQGSYDLATNKDLEADNHERMYNYYLGLLETFLVK